MRILFCADNFPGRFGPLASAFAAEGHEVLFASHYGRRDFSLPGVRRVLLKPARRRTQPESPDEAARQEWARALTTARYASDAFASLRKNGFVPDLCVFSSLSGAALALSRSWPESVLIGCAEGMRARTSREEAEAVVLRLRSCLAQAHACFAFSEDRLAGMPPLLRRHACVLPPAVDTDFFSPEAAAPFILEGRVFTASDSCSESRCTELVSVDMRSLPAASSPALWNICAGLLARRSACRILMNCADPAILAKAESMAAALPAQWRERLFIKEFASMHEWRDMLCATDLHIFPEAVSGRSPLQEVLEAMSCAAPVIMPETSAATVEEFLQGLAGQDGPKAEGCVAGIPRAGVAEQYARIFSLLEDRQARKVLKDKARCLIVSACSQFRAVPEQRDRILELRRQWGQND